MAFVTDMCRFGWRQMIRHRAPLLAAALAYRTIFSLIPVLVLALLLVKAFVGEEGMRKGLRDLMEFAGLTQIRLATEGPPSPGEADFVPGVTLPPAENGSTQLATTIEQFVDRTVARVQGINLTAITIVGILLLGYGAVSLVIQVEQAFNTICRAPTGRRLAVRLTNYWAVLTLGPIALLGGFLISRSSQAVFDGLPFVAALPFGIITRFGLTWLILLFAYTRLPNTRVHLAPAAVGAVVAAVLWEFCKSGLAKFATHLTDPAGGSQLAVYGSLALIPLFLLWIYVTWLIILFGLEIAFAFQVVASGRVRALERLDAGTIVDPGVGVVLVREVARRFQGGKSATAAELAHGSGLADAIVQHILEHLVRTGILHRVERDADTDGFTLARPAERVTTGEVMAAMFEIGGDPKTAREAEPTSDAALLERLRRQQVAALGSESLADLVTGRAAGGASGGSLVQ